MECRAHPSTGGDTHLRSGCRGEQLDKRCLADACLTADGHNAAVTTGRVGEAAVQTTEFGIALEHLHRYSLL